MPPPNSNHVTYHGHTTMSTTTSFRRSSVASRLSYTDQETGEPPEAQIEDEIAEIKRYEDFTTIGTVTCLPS